MHRIMLLKSLKSVVKLIFSLKVAVESKSSTQASISAVVKTRQKLENTSENTQSVASGRVASPHMLVPLTAL